MTRNDRRAPPENNRSSVPDARPSRLIVASKWSGIGIAFVLVACNGQLGDPLPQKLDPGSSPLRRMTRVEYNHAVRDLLGDTTEPARSFTPDPELLGFDDQAVALTVSPLQAEQYMTAAEALSANAIGHLSEILPCDPAADPDACAHAFIETFGKKAYRRPLSSAEKTTLFELFAQRRDTHGFSAGVELVIQAILESPHFLYRVELGMPNPVEGDVVALSPYELASRLSFLLWGSIPDDALLKAAGDGSLSTKAGIATEARRMLDDPKARDAVDHFHEQWLNIAAIETIEKDRTLYPKYNGELRPLWKKETLSFLNHIVFDGGGGLREMLTAPYTMSNRTLADFYGLEGPAGDDFELVLLDPQKNAGILTQASILAVNAKPNQSSPILRGKFVRERLLCQRLPPPPANMPLVLPQVLPGQTTRERFDAHRQNPACAGCHDLLDPIGYTFEHYDPIGLFRDDDQGLPIDSSGQIIDSVDLNGPIVDAIDLAHRLSESEEVRSCVVKQWFRYGYGRADEAEDAHSLAEVQRAFRASGYDIKSLLIALTQTSAFRYRHANHPDPL